MDRADGSGQTVQLLIKSISQVEAGQSFAVEAQYKARVYNGLEFLQVLTEQVPEFVIEFLKG